MKKLLIIICSSVLTLVILTAIFTSSISASSISASSVFASGSITVDCNSTIRGVTHCASGSLYGITERKPSDVGNLVAPLKPNVFTNPARAGSGYQQPVGAAIETAKTINGTTGKVMIRLADICPGWPYKFPGMSSWLSKVKAVINDKKSSGSSNFYGYEIWNEPDGTWITSNGSFNDMWKQTYALIRSSDPNAQIIGPSYSYYNSNNLKNFLSFCKSNNCLPDVVCWHELSSHNSSNNTSSIAGDLKNYRSIESSLGISQRKISINEYCDTDHNKEGAPGPSASIIAKFERYKVDSACITWWFTAYPGRLGSLLATDTQKGAGWWLYKWYGDMSGNMVEVSPPNETSASVDGFACVNSSSKYISFILGGNNNGTINVSFKNVPSFIGSKASVKIEKIDWKNKDTVSYGPTTISTNTLSVTNSSISLSITGCNNTSGYRVYLSPK